jgi:predicted DCC family thiol-disulfide oxidoreductase YuxK
MSPPVPAVVLYDAACPLCRQTVSWLSRRAVRGEFEFLPCQAAERRARFPRIDDAACMEAMHVVLPDGRVLVGAAAFPEILTRLRRWSWLARIFRWPGARRLAPYAYRWIARHRYQLSGSRPRSNSGR